MFLFCCSKLFLFVHAISEIWTPCVLIKNCAIKVLFFVSEFGFFFLIFFCYWSLMSVTNYSVPVLRYRSPPSRADIAGWYFASGAHLSKFRFLFYPRPTPTGVAGTLLTSYGRQLVILVIVRSRVTAAYCLFDFRIFFK